MNKFFSRIALIAAVLLGGAGCELLGFKIEREAVSGTVLEVAEHFRNMTVKENVVAEETNGFGLGAGVGLMVAKMPVPVVGAMLAMASRADVEEQEHTVRVFSHCTVVVETEGKVLRFEQVHEHYNGLRGRPDDIVPCMYSSGTKATLEKSTVYELEDGRWGVQHVLYKLHGIHIKYLGEEVAQ